MAHLSYSKLIVTTIRFCPKPYRNAYAVQVRNLMSKQLVYNQFGDPLHVVKFRECQIPPLSEQDVLVRMLAAPVNPADINTIQGRNYCLPSLPTIPGDEGVGEVVEIGKKVVVVEPGERVVLARRLLGTWRYYGIYHERDLHVISPKLPLPEASMLTIAPCMAYRMLVDFRKLNPGDTVIQNAANSPCGQSVIQLCKCWDINTFNIVANDSDYESVKKHLINLGATAVYKLEEAKDLCCFNTSLVRPVLALNCLGGGFEDIMLKLLERNGSIVYYGCAYGLPWEKQFLRSDACFHRFHLHDWDSSATSIQKYLMLNEIIQLMVVGKFVAPAYKPVELKNYVHAFRNTADCEAFATTNYVFDFTLP